MSLINKNFLGQCFYQSEKSISGFARETEVARGTINNILIGRSNPSLHILNGFIQSFELTQDDFIKVFFPKTEFKKGPSKYDFKY